MDPQATPGRNHARATFYPFYGGLEPPTQAYAVLPFPSFVKRGFTSPFAVFLFYGLCSLFKMSAAAFGSGWADKCVSPMRVQGFVISIKKHGGNA